MGSENQRANFRLPRNNKVLYSAKITDNAINYQSGFASLIILILLVTLSLSGMELFLKANSELRIAKRESERLQAVELADSGLELAKGQLKLNQSWMGEVKSLGPGSIQVDVSKSVDGNSFFINSQASIGSARRGVKAEYKLVNKTWVLLNYEVLHR